MRLHYRSNLFCVKRYPRGLYYKCGFKDAEGLHEFKKKTWIEWLYKKLRYSSILFCVKKYPRSLYYKHNFKDAEQFLKSEGS